MRHQCKGAHLRKSARQARIRVYGKSRLRRGDSGGGQRYAPQVQSAKVLHRAGGRTLVEQVVHACKGLGARAGIHVVVGHQAEQVAAVVMPLGAKTVLQQPQRGTGHALLVARRALAGAKHALVLPGDAPLVRTETLAGLIRAHRDGKAAASILSAMLENPAGYGRVIRRTDGTVSAIVEQTQLAENQRDINEVNSSIYCFD